MNRRATLYVAAVVVAFFALQGWRELSEYDATVQRTEHEMANLARSLRQHADDTYAMAEMALANLVDFLELAGIDAATLPRSRDIMAANLGPQSRLRGMFVFGRNGEWLVNSTGTTPPDANNGDRAYFRHHLAVNDRLAYVGAPVRSRSGGQWVITLSRRINAADGSFAGVATVTIDSAYFAQFYSDLDVGKQGSIVLANMAGQVLSRAPFDEQIIGMDISQGTLFRSYLPIASHGSYHYVSPLDRVSRISGYEQSKRYPVLVIAAVSADEALADWRNNAIQRSIGTALLGLLVILLGIRLTQQMKRLRASEAALAQKESEFRLLAEGASDLVERFDADGIRRYVSPAFERLLGFEPTNMVGTSAFETILPEDRPLAYAAAERLRAGQSVQETITYRAHHKDGRQLWLETSLRIPDDHESGGPGVIAGTRDITERKQLELTLAAMATLDGLTGLGNRRSFDTAIEREMLRARRAGRPISLLMIDVDRFKYFNDEYGHLAGDACLRAIAAVIAIAARRPGDLAARFGGEEMALLLPDTNSAGAAFLAEEICRQIYALGIPHERNVPWAVATVCIGVSTLESRPGEPERSSAWLVSTADMALYQAKSEGRNAARVAPQEITRFAREAS